MKLHLIGVGDYNMTSIIPLEDPCPLPGNNAGHGSGGQYTGAGTGIDNGKPKKISLKNKDILLYAPMANIGRVQMNNNDSKDGGLHIEIKDIHYTKKEMLSVGTGTGISNRKNRSSGDNEYDIHTDNDSLDDDEDRGRGGVKNDEYKYKGTPMGLLRDMQDVSRGVDQLMEESEMTLFPGSQPVRSSQMDGANKGEDEEEGGQVYDSDEDEEGDDEEEESEGSDGDEGEDDSDDEEEEEEEEEEGDSDDEEGEGDEAELLGDDDYDNMDAEDDDEEGDEQEDQPYTTSSTTSKSKPTPTATTTTTTKRNALPSYNNTTTSEEVKSQAVSAYLQRLKDSQSKDLMRRVSYISSIFRAYIYVYMCIP